MKIICAGVGSAFTTKDYYQTSFLIESKTKKRLLFDCGSHAPFALGELGVNNGNIREQIDSIYISHLHGDHIGGLEWLGFCTYFTPGQKLKLFCVDRLMKRLWNRSLRGGMESVEGKVNNLTDYFDTKPIQINESFMWEELECTPVQTVHVMNGMEITLSFGLMVREIENILGVICEYFE